MNPELPLTTCAAILKTAPCMAMLGKAPVLLAPSSVGKKELNRAQTHTWAPQLPPSVGSLYLFILQHTVFTVH